MLSHASYGKSRIRLVRVTRRGDRHEVRDHTVGIRFDGEYGTSYTQGDNRDVLPTDTMKNTVYALAAGGVGEPESFGLKLARHFLDRNPRLRHVSIDLTEHQWRHIAIGEREHGQAFMRRGPETRTAVVSSSRDHLVIDAGVADLVLLKTSGSAFTGFVRDEYTTLPETRDRLFATALTASWRYAPPDVDFGPAWRAIRGILLETFALHVSESVQHTLYAMGEAVLESVEQVASITLTMPNKHHLPVDLAPFGLENRNEVFVATEEPHGLIEATLKR